MSIRRVSALFGLFVLLISGRIALAEPDEAALGKADGYPRGTTTTMYADAFKVGSFSATDKILSSRTVERGTAVMPLVSQPGTEISYRLAGKTYNLDDYLNRQRTTALLVLKGDRIVAERYQYGRSEVDRFISFSMAKSVSSLLIGIALEKRLIASIDDPAEKYVPELAGSGYGQATIRQLLRMSAGVKFREEYDGHDDIAKLRAAQLGLVPQTPPAVLAGFRERSYPAGEKFAYSSSQTTVLGYVLARATKRNISELTSQWLWQPLGAESSAVWNIGVDGQEMTEGNFNATLRDYGRLGRLLANDGWLAEKELVPLDYLLKATDGARQPEAFRSGKATPYYGYGYQFWILPMRTRTFAMLGIFGQAIYVQPATQIVMVHLAVNAQPITPEANTERDALWRGVLETLGGKKE